MTVPLFLKVQGGNKPKKSISEGKIFPKGFLFPSSSFVHVLVQVGESTSDWCEIRVFLTKTKRREEHCSSGNLSNLLHLLEAFVSEREVEL